MMELKTTSLNNLKETITNETMNLLYSTFDLNFGHRHESDEQQMPLNQINEFLNQGYQFKYDLEITFKNDIELNGTLVSKKDDQTYIFNTDGNIFRILKNNDVKFVKLAD